MLATLSWLPSKSLGVLPQNSTQVPQRRHARLVHEVAVRELGSILDDAEGVGIALRPLDFQDLLHPRPCPQDG